MERIPDYGDHMTIEEFKKKAASGIFTDWDGVGFYATKNHMSTEHVNLRDIDEYRIYRDINQNRIYTHVVWFSR